MLTVAFTEQNKRFFFFYSPQFMKRQGVMVLRHTRQKLLRRLTAAFQKLQKLFFLHIHTYLKWFKTLWEDVLWFNQAYRY